MSEMPNFDDEVSVLSIDKSYDDKFGNLIGDDFSKIQKEELSNFRSMLNYKQLLQMEDIINSPELSIKFKDYLKVSLKNGISLGLFNEIINTVYMEARSAQVEARSAQVEARSAQVEARSAQVEARSTQVEARSTQVEVQTEKEKNRAEILNEETKNLAKMRELNNKIIFATDLTNNPNYNSWKSEAEEMLLKSNPAIKEKLGDDFGNYVNTLVILNNSQTLLQQNPAIKKDLYDLLNVTKQLPDIKGIFVESYTKNTPEWKKQEAKLLSSSISGEVQSIKQTEKGTEIIIGNPGNDTESGKIIIGEGEVRVSFGKTNFPIYAKFDYKADISIIAQRIRLQEKKDILGKNISGIKKEDDLNDNIKTNELITKKQTILTEINKNISLKDTEILEKENKIKNLENSNGDLGDIVIEMKELDKLKEQKNDFIITQIKLQNELASLEEIMKINYDISLLNSKENNNIKKYLNEQYENNEVAIARHKFLDSIGITYLDQDRFLMACKNTGIIPIKNIDFNKPDFGLGFMNEMEARVKLIEIFNQSISGDKNTPINITTNAIAGKLHNGSDPSFKQKYLQDLSQNKELFYIKIESNLRNINKEKPKEKIEEKIDGNNYIMKYIKSNKNNIGRIISA